jgi:hypothetical protein
MLVRYAPKDKEWRRRHLPEAIILRRIPYQIRGFRPSAIITNLTDSATISREEWIGMATHQAGQVLDDSLYHHRWQIETTFAELKVCQGLGKLRSRTPESISYEIGSHIVLYLLVRWLMVEAAQAQRLEPLRLSFTASLREIHDMIPALVISTSQRIRRVLLPRLLTRISQHQVPERRGRHYPRPNDTKIRNLGGGRQQMPSKLTA